MNLIVISPPHVGFSINFMYLKKKIDCLMKHIRGNWLVSSNDCIFLIKETFSNKTDMNR